MLNFVHMLVYPLNYVLFEKISTLYLPQPVHPVPRVVESPCYSITAQPE